MLQVQVPVLASDTFKRVKLGVCYQTVDIKDTITTVGDAEMVSTGRGDISVQENGVESLRQKECKFVSKKEEEEEE